VGVCIDEKVDDVGYMETLVRTVIKRLPVVRSQVSHSQHRINASMQTPDMLAQADCHLWPRHRLTHARSMGMPMYGTPAVYMPL
jgi:hypothetical protein